MPPGIATMEKEKQMGEVANSQSQSKSKQDTTDSLRISSKSLERHVRRFYAGTDQQLFASCSPGFERILLDEIRAFPGLSHAESVEGGVEFSGPVQLVYHANLKLRSAERILLRVGAFHVKSYPELFNRVQRMPWEAILGGKPQLNFRLSASQSRLHHTRRLEETFREAIRKRYSNFTEDSFLPGKENSIQIFIRFFQDRCTISLDTTGVGLHRRGYRNRTGKAPLRENLAAALLLSLDLKSYPVILDPCAGSGTFLFEAISILEGYPPGFQRNFSFEKLPFYKEKAWRHIYHQAVPSFFEIPEFKGDADFQQRPVMIGNDIDPSVIEAARKNAGQFPPVRFLEFVNGNALELENHWGRKGLLVSNLPYGMRILNNKYILKKFYREFLQLISSKFSGWDFLFVIENPHLLKRDSIHILRKIPFENGGLRVEALSGNIL